MDPIRQTQKKYCSQAMLIAIFGGLALILLGQKAMGKGLVLGTLFSAVNFALAGEWIHFQLGHGKAKTFFLSIGAIIFRYAFIAVPIILSIKMEQFNILATIFGIFMIQILIAGNYLIRSLLPTSID